MYGTQNGLRVPEDSTTEHVDHIVHTRDVNLHLKDVATTTTTTTLLLTISTIITTTAAHTFTFGHNFWRQCESKLDGITKMLSTKLSGHTKPTASWPLTLLAGGRNEI